MAAATGALVPERPFPAVDGVEHRFVDAGFVRLHVAEAGPADGDPVVMLHGWPQHWYMWRNQIGPLAEAGYRVICPDLRGFGWSEAPAWGYEKQQLAADVLALLDTIGLDRVRLAGHDWGGIVSFWLCIRHPERIERFVCLNSGGPWTKLSATALANGWRWSYQLALASPWLGRRFSAWVGRLAARRPDLFVERPGAWTTDDAAAFFEPFAELDRGRAAQLTYRAFVTRELPAIMRGRFDRERVTTPTLCLHGREDPVLRPDNVRAVEDHADELEFELVDGAGHFVAEDAPDLVSRRMLEFFSASSAASPRPAESTGTAA